MKNGEPSGRRWFTRSPESHPLEALFFYIFRKDFAVRLSRPTLCFTFTPTWPKRNPTHFAPGGRKLSPTLCREAGLGYNLVAGGGRMQPSRSARSLDLPLPAKAFLVEPKGEQQVLRKCGGLSEGGRGPILAF